VAAELAHLPHVLRGLVGWVVGGACLQGPEKARGATPMIVADTPFMPIR